MAGWRRGQDAIMAERIRFEEKPPCLSFLDYIFHEEHEIGPFLFVISPSSLFSWYDTLRPFPDMISVVYSGSKLSRMIAQALEFVKPGSCQFHSMLTTPETVLEDIELLETINWRIVFS
jgi:hypothetical protein